MERAILLALKGKGRTSPNPAVGAVIVKNGQVVGEGWHKKRGGAHAEIFALKAAGAKACGATAYVTLEPCNHYGQTGPCARALVEAGIKEVVIGARDKSPKQGRRGMEEMRRAGITVRQDLLGAQCKELCEDFFKHSSTGLPFVTLKTAMTLDGKIASRSGDSRWISSEQSRKLVHEMRCRSDAVMVGADTAILDDPQLTTRAGRARRNPLRVVVDGALRLPLKGNLAQGAGAIPTLVFTTKALAAGPKAAALEKLGVRVMAAGKGKKVDLPQVMAQLGRMDVMSLMVESGGALAWELARLELVDRVKFFIAPKIVGGPRCVMGLGGVARVAEAYRMEEMEVSMVGPDIMVDGKMAPRR
ncbi:MAG: bifunctional diaminohydroxyphosphoribosylaminopyrimidine deaminase/5-amino-6-(5-phosphoribosylamino)uracil reductase RibD [Nitrospinota bacterium]|nr:bifunctional diaminohydroxyphosphoribosylaminopyrimidine deaminase/5-amino-6-(5-phosphoribosylamino)uracil reductase RibD [Nitrospinota bacterium]